MIIRVVRVLLVVGALVGAFKLGQAFALGNPDTIEIDLVYRYDDVVVTGDLFLLAEYQILYDTTPTESVTQGWLARVIDQGGSGTEATVQPFSGGSIPNSGYSRGVFGFYFTEEPTITGTLRIALSGNPSLSPTPTGIFTETITTRTNQQLQPDIREIALRVEDTWDVDLVSPQDSDVNRFTENGEEYFASALPNLRNLAPDLFVTSSVNAEFPNRTFDTSYRTSRENTFSGTTIDTGFASLGTFLNVSQTVAEFIFMMALAIGIAAILQIVAKDMQYLHALQILMGFFVMMVGAWLGLVDLRLLAILAVASILATGFVFYFQRTA